MKIACLGILFLSLSTSAQDLSGLNRIIGKYPGGFSATHQGDFVISFNHWNKITKKVKDGKTQIYYVSVDGPYSGSIRLTTDSDGNLEQLTNTRNQRTAEILDRGIRSASECHYGVCYTINYQLCEAIKLKFNQKEAAACHDLGLKIRDFFQNSSSKPMFNEVLRLEKLNMKQFSGPNYTRFSYLFNDDGPIEELEKEKIYDQAHRHISRYLTMCEEIRPVKVPIVVNGSGVKLKYRVPTVETAK